MNPNLLSTKFLIGIAIIIEAGLLISADKITEATFTMLVVAIAGGYYVVNQAEKKKVDEFHIARRTSKKEKPLDLHGEVGDDIDKEML